MGHSDGEYQSSLKRTGFWVGFHLTREANDALQATIGENVRLIRSIAAEHLAEVHGMVMRSVQTGQDLGGLADELQERYALTRRRAAFIARDQNSKATVVRVRQEGLGITEAIWCTAIAVGTCAPWHACGGGWKAEHDQRGHVSRWDVDVAEVRAELPLREPPGHSRSVSGMT